MHGDKAKTEESSKLDTIVKKHRDKLIYEMNVSTYFQSNSTGEFLTSAITVLTKLPNELKEKWKIDLQTGLQPDGGLWFKYGDLVLAFEAKKQEARGNADERWDKNYGLCKYHINENVMYVTFLYGSGFEDGERPRSHFRTILNRYDDGNRSFNTLYKTGPSFYILKDLNEGYVLSVMKKAIDLAMTK